MQKSPRRLSLHCLRLISGLAVLMFCEKPALAETDVPTDFTVDIEPTAAGLVNVTAPPLETPQPQTPAPASTETPPVLPIALGMIVIAILGLGGLYVSQRRR